TVGKHVHAAAWAERRLMRHRAQIATATRGMRPDDAITLSQRLAGRIMRHTRAQTSHASHHLVAENDGQWNTPRGPQFPLPQVHVRATDGGGFDFDQDGPRL